MSNEASMVMLLMLAFVLGIVVVYVLNEFEEL